jgi:DHA2 family multidrug resistance protein-like MFS transporter
VFTLTTDLIVGSAPPERAGAASAISETGAEFGGALGIAIFGSIGIAVYRRVLARDIPAGVPPEAAASARETLAGALEVAEQFPAQLGSALADAARGAFIAGLQLAVGISAILALGLAIFVVVMLRRMRTGSEPEREPDLIPDRQSQPAP